MGMDTQDYLHNYFFGATQDQDVDPNTGKDVYVYRLAKEVRMDYDAAAKTLKTDNYLDINADAEKEASHDVFYMPVIAWQPEDINLQPEKPAIFDYFTYNEKEGVGGILFDLNQYNVDGQLIDSHKMYYRILVDEDVLEVDPADYQSTTEKMTDIPYWYTDYTDIFGRRVTHEFYFFVRDFDFMGMVAIYRDGEEEYISPIATCYGTAPACWDNLPKGKEVGINQMSVNAQPVSQSYINLQGARVSSPEHGLYIRTTTYSDGTVKHDKVLK